MKKEFILFAALLSAQFSLAQKQDSLKTVNIEEVQIIASRVTEKTPLAYSNISKEQIGEQNFAQDIPFLLTLSPSVVATSDAGTGIGYTGFRIRGTDANRINITTNGIPLNDSESHGVFWVNMPDFASSLEDLQIQRGVGTSTMGAGAFGASVNMKTENISLTPYGEFNGAYGSFNTAKVNLKLGTGRIANHWAFDGRLSSITSDGYIDRASADLKSYFFQGGYYNDNTMVKFITFGGKEKTYHAWDGVPKDKMEAGDRTFNPSGHMKEDDNGNPLPPFYDNQTDNYIQTHYQLFFMHLFDSSLQLNVALHYTPGKGYYEEYKIGRTLQEYGLNPFITNDGTVVDKSDLVRQKWLDNDFYGGIFSLNYKKNKWDVALGGGANNYTGEHFGKVIWVQNYIGGPDFYPGHEFYRSDARKAEANLYLKANYALNSQLNIYGDVQYRFIDYKINGDNDVWDWQTGAMQWLDIHEKFNFFNPKAGLFYHINSRNDLYTSFAVAHREPNRNNYTDASSDEKPVYETLYDYELGYTFKYDWLAAGVNLYYMKYNNQLVLTGKVNEIGEPLTSNIPDSYRTGVELTLAAKICSCLKWNGNLTLSRNRINNYTEYVDWYDQNWEWAGQINNYLGNTPIAFSPDVTAGSLFSFNYKNWDAGFQSIFVGKQYIDNSGSNDRSLDAYFVNNLRLGYTFHVKNLKSLKLSAVVNNLFNEKYESNAWVYSYYQQPDAGNPSMNRLADFGYFTQAGANVLFNLNITF
ncbi:MAG: TonB-dependent receptor [Candidatus Azobacteroides sp.]|nr:TonB-dependent receptor [Candidatus Azobacteroides sp.]